MKEYGYKLVTDGTDNHLVLWDLRKEVRGTVPPDALCGCFPPLTRLADHHAVLKAVALWIDLLPLYAFVTPDWLAKDCSIPLRAVTL